MIYLYDAETGTRLGRISDDDLTLLTELLEEAQTPDQGWAIDSETLDLLADQGAGERLLRLLGRVLDDQDAAEVRWEYE